MSFGGATGREEEASSGRGSGVSGDNSGAKEVGGLSAFTARGGEESLEEATADGAKDVLGDPDS